MIPAKQVILAGRHYTRKGDSERLLPTTQNVLARLTGEYLSTGDKKL